MFIQTEATPNPLTVKFIPGRVVMAEGTKNFPKALDAVNSPLARNLFAIDGVDGVFFGADFISVTKKEENDWGLLKPSILGAIMEHFVSNKPLFVEDKAKLDHAPANDQDDAISAEIRELIDARVRPAVAMDGGDIIFDRFEDGIVYVRMQGACAGCPSSSVTLKSGIENILKHYVPEVKEIRAIE